jgi:hypothetical protein
MTPLRTRLALLLTLALAACGGGGFGADGGVSGTGISAVTGNVAEVIGTAEGIEGIRVAVAGTDVETRTDAAGLFTLTGELAGPITLVFERESDGLRARADVRVPAGGTLRLDDLTLDARAETAKPERQAIAFEGEIVIADCAAGRLVVVSRRDRNGAEFVVLLAGAFLHDPQGAPVACADLSAGEIVVVAGRVLEDDSIGEADLEVAARRPEPSATPRATAAPTATTARPSATPTRAREEPTATRPGSTATPARPEPTPSPGDGRPGREPPAIGNRGDRR